MGDPILDFFDNSDLHDPTSHEVYGKPYNQLTFGQQDYVRSREEARGIVFSAIDEPSSGNAWFVRLIFGLFLLVPSFLGFSNMSVSFSSPQAALENVPVNVFFLSLFFGSLFLMLGGFLL